MNFLSRIGAGSTHAGIAAIGTIAMQALPASAAPYAGGLAALFAVLAMLIPDTGSAAKPAEAISIAAAAAPIATPQ